MDLNGIHVAITTPFNKDVIDTDSLRRHINFLIEAGVHGIVVAGTTGEAATLSTDEQQELLRTTINIVAKRTIVIAGIGSNNTREACAHVRTARKYGAQYGLDITPYYNKPSQEGLYLHHKTIAAETDLPIILYNVPSRTCTSLAPETVARLAQISNIVGLKDASGDLAYTSNVIHLCGSEFSVLCGNDSLNLASYALGCIGAISVTANVAPHAVIDIWHAYSSGECLRARTLHYELELLNKALFLETNPIPVKAALAMMNMMSGECRSPLCMLSDVLKTRLRDTLSLYNLL